MSKRRRTNKQLEVENVKLKAKYDAAFAKGQDAMKAKKFDDALTSFRLASATMQTDEAAAAVKQAQTELAKANEQATLEAKKNAEEKQRAAIIAKRLTEGRNAMNAKRFDAAITAFKAAAAGNQAGRRRDSRSIDQAEFAR